MSLRKGTAHLSGRYLAWAAALVLLVACVAGASGPWSHGDDSHRPLPLIAVTVTGPEQAQRLADAGLDIAGAQRVEDGIEIDILLWPQDAARLRQLGFPYEVKWADMRTLPRPQIGAAGEDPGILRTTYRTLNEYNSEMSQIAGGYPGLAQRVSIGTSYQGRTIYALNIAAPVDSWDGRPETALIGLHHAREWPSGEYTMNMAWDLVQKYGTDPAVTQLLDSTRVWIIPVQNPDGLYYAQNYDDMWRKNRRPVGWGYGVDTNRNYSYQWGGPGSSGWSGSQTYRGSAPFSEYECRAIRDLFLERQIVTMITNHTYSDLVLWPWGYTSTNAPDAGDLSRMGQDMAAYNGYDPMQASDLYVASGITDDWSYGVLANYGFTFEHGRSFHPDYSIVNSTYPSQYPAFLYCMQKADYHASVISGTITDASTGLPIAADLTLSRTYTVPQYGGGTTIETMATGLHTTDGQYAWHVTPSRMPMEGSDPGYTLTVESPGYQTGAVTVSVGRRQTVTADVALNPS